MPIRTQPAPRALPEPVLRPIGQGRPGFDIARNCRVGFAGSALVASGRDGVRRRFPVGEGGIVRAVMVDVQGAETAGGMGMPLPGGWGELRFLDAADSVVVRLRLDDWIPEADRLAVRPVGGERLLARSGAGALLKKAGLPVSVVEEAPQVAGGQRIRVPHALPAWYAATRGIAAAVWFVAWLVGLILRPEAPWLLVLAGLAALAGPVAHLAVRAADAAREHRTNSASGTRISPVPEQGAGATARFCRTAAVRVEAREIVLVDGLGRERRLARSGAHGVTRLVRRTDRKTGEPVGVELCGPDGQIRGALPWRWWFAGPGGAERLRELREAAGLEGEERALRKGEFWPDDRVARADAMMMGRLPARLARRKSRFPESTLGGANWWLMTLMAVFTLGAGLGESGDRRALVLLLSGLALCGAVLPVLAHELTSRLHRERPAPPR